MPVTAPPAQVSSPDKLTDLTVTLTDRYVHSGDVIAEGDGTWSVTTGDAPWAYGTSFALEGFSVDEGETVLLSLSGIAEQGKVGVLFAVGDRVLREVFFEASVGEDVQLVAISAFPGTRLIVRNADRPGVSRFRLTKLRAFAGFDGQFRIDPDFDLQALTAQPFTPHANRKPAFVFGGLTTTEVCELSCVFCHFNGPQATKLRKTLTPAQVEKVLHQLPAGTSVAMAGTGDLFRDQHAVVHVETALRLGHDVSILTHGQSLSPSLIDELLALGLRQFRMSVDAIEERAYAKIRRGGTFANVMAAVEHLQQRKADFPDLKVEITCTLLPNSIDRRDEFEAFWTGKVDRLLFNVEYFDTFKFRNVLAQPRRRNDCEIATYVVPSGRITPCCAMMVHQHDRELDWLPHIDTHSLQEAYDLLCDLYEDTDSPLAKLCAKCDWWIMWAKDQANGNTAYFESRDLDYSCDPKPVSA